LTTPQRYPHSKGCYRTAWGTWFVQIRVDGVKHYLGTCETQEEAIQLRDAFLASINKQAPVPEDGGLESPSGGLPDAGEHL
jgi:hypothetical protein